MLRAQLSLGSLDVLRGTELRHRFTPHMHEFFAIGLIDAGQACVRYRGSDESASAGALITISAGETHTGSPATDEGWSYRMIYPHRSLLRAALGDLSPEGETPLFASPFVRDAEVQALFVDAYRSLVGDDCVLAKEENVLALLRSIFARHSSRQPATSATKKDARVAAAARDYLEAHFSEPVSLAGLAEVCGANPFQLVRLFSRAYGMPPHAYLKQIRIARALTMLQSGMPVSQVAHSCGFSDQSHLTRNFKSTFGMPPGAYQRGVGATGGMASSYSCGSTGV